MKPGSPVAVSGIGCLCAPGMNLSACMDSIFNLGKKPASPVGFSSSHPVSYPVFEILTDLDLSGFDKKKEILRTSQLALLAAKDAVVDSGLTPEILSEKKVGVCIGTTVGSALNNEEFYYGYREGQHPDMLPIQRFLNSNPASCIAEEFNLSGPCQTVVNACSSGSDAIGTGASWIRSGICDIVLAGGADELSRITYNGFISLMISDSKPCSPFDRNRNGLNLGEGSAILVLESERILQERKKNSRAFIYGYGSASDAYHLTAPKPDGEGLKKALSEAMAASGVAVQDISFINAHGTGTRDNDRVEGNVIGTVFPTVPFFSNKGYTGHTLGAAGAIGAAFTIACLEQQRVPANAGFKEEDPELSISPTTVPAEISGSYAVTESLAFGGNNAVLVIGKERLKSQ